MEHVGFKVGGRGVKVDNTDPNVEVEANVGSMDHGSMDLIIMLYYDHGTFLQ